MSDAPFFHTLPLWVLDAATLADVNNAAITDANVTAKQAVLTVDGQDKPVKVFRRHAFPGRTVES
jgi:hypothetical protein